jgi:type IV pilus assembly protein PilC
MAIFQYKAIAAGGGVTEGTIDAGGRADAIRQLEGQGLDPLKIIEGAGKGKARQASGAPWQSKKVTPAMLENFTRLLSSLLSAGLPLSRALVILYKEASTPAAKEKWKEIHDLVIDGMALNEAMAKSPEVFPKIYTAMVNAGETGGFLDVVLNQIADFQAREKELKSKVMTALLDPVILLVMAMGVLVFLMTFFIPRFQTLFEGFGAELPLLTQAIVGTSNFMTSPAAIWGLVFAGVAGYALRNWLITDKGRRARAQATLKIPVIGSLVARYAMARFCRMLGTLLGAGVSLISALTVASKAIGNQMLTDTIADSIEGVKKGDALGPSLGKSKELFPSSILEMIGVAEESSRLDEELVRIADVAEIDLDRQLKTAVALTEPLMLFFIAGFIGTIFIGMVLPIFSLQDHIK